MLAILLSSAIRSDLHRLAQKKLSHVYVQSTYLPSSVKNLLLTLEQQNTSFQIVHTFPPSKSIMSSKLVLEKYLQHMGKGMVFYVWYIQIVPKSLGPPNRSAGLLNEISLLLFLRKKRSRNISPTTSCPIRNLSIVVFGVAGIIDNRYVVRTTG